MVKPLHVQNTHEWSQTLSQDLSDIQHTHTHTHTHSHTHTHTLTQSSYVCDHESTEAEPAVWQLADDLKNIETVMVAILSPEKHRCVSGVVV